MSIPEIIIRLDAFAFEILIGIKYKLYLSDFNLITIDRLDQNSDFIETEQICIDKKQAISKVSINNYIF